MRILSALALLLLLAGCPVYQMNRLPDSTSLRQPLTLSVDGEFTHAPSRYRFPAEVAPFKRVALRQYDSAGLDVSAGYNARPFGCLIAITIYVYPAPRESFAGADPALVRESDARRLQAGYERGKQEITSVHPGASLRLEDLPVQDGVTGMKAIYQFDDRDSELLVFIVDHTWYLKYRITYPTACAGLGRDGARDFLRTWRRRAD